MKAMKKILFLTLIFALALTATAFAGGTGKLTDWESEILPVINYLDSVKDTMDCGVCAGADNNLKGTWTSLASLTADCTKAAVVDVKCEECGTFWSANFARKSAHDWDQTTVKVEKTDDATCVTPGTSKTTVKCAYCGTKSESVTTNTPAAYGHTMLTDLLNDELNGQKYDASKPMTAAFAQALENVVADWNKNYADYSKDVDANLKDSYAFQGKNLKVDYTPADACKAGYIKVTCDHCKAVLFEQEFAGEHEWEPIANYVGALPTCDTPGELYVDCVKCGQQLKLFLPAYGHKIDYDVLYIRQNGKLVATTPWDNIDGNGKIMDLAEVKNLMGKDFVECEVYQLVYACELYDLELKALTLHIDEYVKALKNVDLSQAELADLAKVLLEGITNVKLGVEKCNYIEYEFGAKILPALWDHVYDLNNLNKEYNEFTKKGEFAGNCFEPAHFYLCCNACDWSEKIVGAEPSHKWCALKDGKVTKKATCSANGEIELYCTVPNCEGKKTVATDMLAHDLYWQHTGDCKRAGKLEETCRVCETVVTTIEVGAWHDPAQRSNITLDNAELIKTINENGLVMNIYDVVDCTKNGTVKYFCGKCKTNVTETIEATGHNFNLENADLNKNGKADDQKIVASLETIIAGNLYDQKQDGIVQPTCTTYGYIYLQCTNPNCTKTEKIKNAEKLEHFTKKITASEVMIPSTCTEVGTKTEVCYCGKTQTTELAKKPHTPTKVDGKDVCVVCGTELKLETEYKFEIQTTEMTVTSTGVSGRGVIDQWENMPQFHDELYARINYNFTLDNGESYAYIACVEVAEDGSFRAASPACPHGATLTNVTIMITTDADAQDKVISEVTNLGVKVVK